jgi:hypothetical protein
MKCAEMLLFADKLSLIRKLFKLTNKILKNTIGFLSNEEQTVRVLSHYVKKVLLAIIHCNCATDGRGSNDVRFLVTLIQHFLISI